MNASANDTDHIANLGDFLNWAADYFDQQDLYFGHGTDNGWDEAVMLALYVLKLPAENDTSILNTNLTPNQKQQLIDLAKRRVAERIPVAYLTHEAWFAGERYYVNRDVIIPRSPMAELIANHFQPWLGNKEPQRILDLCTGSGCIAIYCAKEFPRCRIDAVDISDKALAVAKRNVELHHCAKRVELLESDLFSAVANRKYDIIISNPPYVSADDMRTLPDEYLHEPQLALASGEDGLDLTLQIIDQARNYLTDDGLLIVEVGNSWQTLADRFPKIPFTWLEFSNGGEGVFLLTAGDLKK